MIDMNDLFSGLQLQDIALLDLQFKVDGRVPVGNSRITVTMETSKTTYDEAESGTISTTKLLVRASIDGETDEAGEPVMRFSAHVAVLYQASPSMKINDTIRLELRSRSIADGYSFIRNHAMLLAGLSTVRHLVLPSIDISTLV